MSHFEPKLKQCAKTSPANWKEDDIFRLLGTGKDISQLLWFAQWDQIIIKTNKTSARLKKYGPEIAIKIRKNAFSNLYFDKNCTF